MRYSGIIFNDIVNTEGGFALSVFTQGCPHRCAGCFNPETWDFEGGQEIEQDVLIETILTNLRKNGIKRNLSILGGEPLAPQNLSFTIELIKQTKAKYPDTKIYIWTGYLYNELPPSTQMILSQYCDTIIDGPFDIEQRDLNLKLCGSRNQRVLRKGVDF